MAPSNAPNNDLRWQRRKESRPSEIIEAAFELFTLKGFSATRMDEIALKAGISKGSLYNYFKSKEAIFEAVVTDDIIPIIDQIEESLATKQESSAKLIRGLIHVLITHSQGTRLEIIPKLIVSESGNFPELTEFFVKQVVKRVRGIIQRVIQRGIERQEFIDCDPLIAARLLIGPIIQAHIWNHTFKPYDDPHDAQLYMETHLRIFLHGIERSAQHV